MCKGKPRPRNKQSLEPDSEILRSKTEEKKASQSLRKERQRAAKKLYDKYIRSDAFKDVRSLVLARDGNRCKACGRTAEEGAKLSVHHCTYEHLGCGGEEEAQDCVTLCSVCHLCVHRCKANIRRFTFKDEEIEQTVPRLRKVLAEESARKKEERARKRGKKRKEDEGHA